MIYFNQKLVAKALKEVSDYIDVEKDVSHIQFLVNSPYTKDVLTEAQQLNHELRKKYSTIETMLAFAATMPKINFGARDQPLYADNAPAEIKALVQDYYGILADVLIKKGIIQKIEQFIDHVTEN